MSKNDDTNLKHESLIKILKLNAKQIKIIAMLASYTLLSIHNIKEDIEKNTIKEMNEIKMEFAKDESMRSNNFLLEYYRGKSIVIANFDATVEKEYELKDGYLYDSNNNTISLKDSDKDTYMFSCKLDKNILQNLHLKESNIKTLGLNGSAVGNYIVDYLPSSLEMLSLRGCSFITNLDELPNKCPNIEYLNLNLMASLTDLSFIYKMPNLKEIHIDESAYITDDLLNYLEQNNIKTNLTVNDIMISKKTDLIIDEIITPNMSDTDKIKAIVIYVINNLKYDMNIADTSNSNPLSQALYTGNGVCTSYAYLTNVLLNKAGIESYKIVNEDHAWNMVKLDNKYYYVDPTNINPGEFYQFLLKSFNLSKNYMVDTEELFNSSMTKPSDDKTIIPLDLINDILSGRDDKTLTEKYGGKVTNMSYYLGSILAGFATYFGFVSFMGTVMLSMDLGFKLKEDYYEEVSKKLIKEVDDEDII